MSEYCPYTYKGYPKGHKYPWIFPMPSEKERDRRWDAIRKSMKKHNFDCLIIGAPFGYMPTPDNHLYYVTNYVVAFGGNQYAVFPLKGEPQLGVSTWIRPQHMHLATELSWIREIVAKASILLRIS